jgi:hypothetical protein
MPFLELFSSSFLLTIAIVVILIGVVFAYISYRMSDQDHKISSMVSLVSTMAEELQFFRTKMNTLTPSTATTFQQYSPPMHTRNGGSLIEVSDDEEDEYEDEDESEDSDDDNVENEYNSSTNQDNSDEDEDEDDDDASRASDESDHIKSIHLDESDLEPFVEHSLNDDAIDLTTLPIPHIDETLHPEEDIKDNPELKTISITEDIDDSTNYKRMSLAKLRNIVVEKGLVNDSSKMKKQELLKLLGEE